MNVAANAGVSWAGISLRLQLRAITSVAKAGAQLGHAEGTDSAMGKAKPH